ncbi:hypothetical protein RAB80_017158 [Fusarium oxysporum f. sp. vasinfectum]|nr:hypothetical protein RAB80_017158 [Fusarium oxysporum f. sp. vasinfectum]
MKVETPLYYALMLARFASGQNFSPECDDAGPVLYPGTWNQYLAPNMGMISVETRPPDDAREASATEYAITQDCPVNPTLTSEKYASASSKPTTPDPTGSGRSGSSDTDSATSTTNGDMPNETTLPLTGSHAAGSGAAQTTQSSEYTDIAAPALPESGKTHAPPSPSNEAQASGDNRPCTCGQ